MNDSLIQKAKEKLLSQIAEHGEDPWHLEVHLIEAEKWAKKILNDVLPANRSLLRSVTNYGVSFSASLS